MHKVLSIYIRDADEMLVFIQIRQQRRVPGV